MKNLYVKCWWNWLQNVNVGHNNVAIADDFEDEENLFDDDDYSDFDDDVHEVIPSLMKYFKILLKLRCFAQILKNC